MNAELFMNALLKAQDELAHVEAQMAGASVKEIARARVNILLNTIYAGQDVDYMVFAKAIERMIRVLPQWMRKAAEKKLREDVRVLKDMSFIQKAQSINVSTGSHSDEKEETNCPDCGLPLQAKLVGIGVVLKHGQKPSERKDGPDEQHFAA